jgi:protein SCO1/2
MAHSRTGTLLAVVALAALGAGVGAFTARYYHSPPAPPEIPGLLWPNPKQVGAFEAVDEEGRPFGLERLKGRWSFLFFGYTNCPDVCPITLAVLDRVQRQAEAGNVQTVFVSVDPERDTLERIKQYVEYFNPEFSGVGGSLAQVRSLTDQLGIPFVHEPPGETGNYFVDHSAAVFLVDPEARLVSVFSPPHDAGEILGRFREIRAFIEDEAS